MSESNVSPEVAAAEPAAPHTVGLSDAERAAHDIRAWVDDMAKTFPSAPIVAMARRWADLLAPPPSAAVAEPAYWRCTVCGCLWRDNHDGTLSLGSAKQTSCAECEKWTAEPTCEALYAAALRVDPKAETPGPEADDPNARNRYAVEYRSDMARIREDRLDREAAAERQGVAPQTETPEMCAATLAIPHFALPVNCILKHGHKGKHGGGGCEWANIGKEVYPPQAPTETMWSEDQIRERANVRPVLMPPPSEEEVGAVIEQGLEHERVRLLQRGRISEKPAERHGVAPPPDPPAEGSPQKDLRWAVSVAFPNLPATRDYLLDYIDALFVKVRAAKQDLPTDVDTLRRLRDRVDAALDEKYTHKVAEPCDCGRPLPTMCSGCIIEDYQASVGHTLERGAAERSPAPTWQPIETAPKNELVLVAFATDDTQTAYLDAEGYGAGWRNVDNEWLITPWMWMQLPSPPSAGSEASKT